MTGDRRFACIPEMTVPYALSRGCGEQGAVRVRQGPPYDMYCDVLVPATLETTGSTGSVIVRMAEAG